MFISFHHFFQLDILANAIKYAKKREVKSIHIGKEDMKLSLFTGNMIIYVKNPKELTTTIIQSIRQNSWN